MEFCDLPLQFNFVLAPVPGVENPGADYLSRLEIRPEDRIHLKLIDAIPVFQVEIDIASKTPTQEEDENDYYLRDEADENIRKHRSSTLSDKTSGQQKHEHLTATENDVHQMTAQGDTGHRKTSLKDQMTFVRLVNRGSLPPRAMNSIGPSTMDSLQVVQENSRDIQKFRAITLERRAPPTHMNFESQFFQKLYTNIKYLEIVKGILCRKYFDNTGKVLSQQAVVPEEFIKDIIRTLLEEIFHLANHSNTIPYLYNDMVQVS